MDDIFRRFFGFRRFDPPDSRDDGHGINVGEGDEDLFNNFSNPRGGLKGMFEHFHRDMFHQMESLQREMNDMMKDFGAVDFPSENLPPLEPNDSTKDCPSSRVFIWSTPSPFFRQGDDSSKKTLRDFMLKDEGETESSTIMRPKKPEKRMPISTLPQNPGSGIMEKREDSDLDGTVSDDKLLDMIKKSSAMNSPAPHPEPWVPAHKPSRILSGQSVSISTYSGPDGKVEQKRVLRDSTGREESTVTRSMGDKSYTVTTVTDETGKQEKHENLQNMDESDLNNFKQLWSTPRPQISRPSPESSINIPVARPSQPRVSLNPEDRSLFDRLFGGRD